MLGNGVSDAAVSNQSGSSASGAKLPEAKP